MPEEAVTNLIIPASGEVGALDVGVLVPRQILSSLHSQLVYLPTSLQELNTGTQGARG